MAAVIELPLAPVASLAPRTAPTLVQCLHCHTPFLPTEEQPTHCCHGCQFVYGLIHGAGLERYYELQPEVSAPVRPIVFQQRDFSWLDEAVAATASHGIAKLEVEIQGLSCLACVWLVEEVFQREPGALAVHVDPGSGLAEFCWDPSRFQPRQFACRLQQFGYLLGPRGEAGPRQDRALLIRLGVCGALAMNTMLFTLPLYLGMSADFRFAPLFQRCALVLATLSLLIGGSEFFRRSWRGLRQGILHLDFPISLGLVAAWGGSVWAWYTHAPGFLYFDFVSTFTFLMLLGRWLQQQAAERNRRQLLARQAQPTLLAEDGITKVPAAEVADGTRYWLAPGAVLPVSSQLLQQSATISREWVNGESDAEIVPAGRTLPAGAVNCGSQPVLILACEDWSHSLLHQLMQLRPGPAPRDLGLERFIRRYSFLVLSLSVIGLLGWWWAGSDLSAALQVFISVLVVSCPCASGVAIPLCADLAATRLRAAGVFVRDPHLWRKLDRVRQLVFDKTGTLSPAALSLQNPRALAELPVTERALLLALIQHSPHPVSCCLREQLMAANVAPLVIPPVEEKVGFGLQITYAGHQWRLGRAGWAGGSGADCNFSRDGKTLAAFHFAEVPRGDAVAELSALHQAGYTLHVLSGDREEKVAAMARQLGVPLAHCHARLTPEAKAAWIQEHDCGDTLYLGDGANDSLAFDAATCTGTPAIEQGLLEQKAGFYFLGRGLGGVRGLLAMAHRRKAAATAVLAFAIMYNVGAVALSLAGRMNPLLAAVLMPASSLVSLAIVYGYFGLADSGAAKIGFASHKQG